MPMYMDIHDVPGVTPEDVAKAHLEDVRIQAKHGVEYVKYWLNQKQGKIYCLCTAPSAKAADAVHREAHGLAAARILKVTPDLADAFMGAAESDNAGAALLPGNAGRDPGTRGSIPDASISRRHARITVRGEAATLEDLDSKNGTWVGENRVVGPTPLSDGDTIRLGLVHLVFRAPPGSLSTTKTVR